MAKKTEQTKASETKTDKPEETPEPIKRKVGDAGQCERNPNHKNIRVYRTVGKTRYCVCDDCGATWKTVGPYSSSHRNYLEQLAEDLENAKRTAGIIAIEDKAADDIARTLREIAAS